MARVIKALFIFVLAGLLLAGCVEQPKQDTKLILEAPPTKEAEEFTSYPIEAVKEKSASEAGSGSAVKEKSASEAGSGSAVKEEGSNTEPAEEETSWALPMFRFEGEDEIGRFVLVNVNVFIERAVDSSDEENHVAEATFYRSAEVEGKSIYFYVLTHPLRGRYADWSAVDEVSFFVRNSNDFAVPLKVDIDDEAGARFTREIDLEPMEERTVRIKTTDLARAGLDLSKVKRFTFRMMDEDITGIATLDFDDFILTGSDRDALQKMKAASEAESLKQLHAMAGEERAAYLPKVLTDKSSLNEVWRRFDAGHIDGVAKCGVVVVGGGLSGCSAAIAASRAGADVILIEAYGFLGGMATAGMVFPFMNSRAGNEQIIEGIFIEIYKRLAADGMAKRDEHSPGIIWFDKEALKYALQEMCIESGVKLMLHTWAEAPLQWQKGSRVEGVVVGNKSGRIAVLGDVTIDCTGDGDIAAGAGCPFEMGRGYDPYTQSVTLFFRMGNVNTDRAFGELYDRVYRSEDYIPAEFLFADKFKQAKANGDLDPDLPISVVYFERTMSPGVVSINATRVFKVDATNAVDLSYAEVEARRQVHQMSRFLKKYIPGFERAFLQESAISIGVRESRRILGEYQLTGRDVLSARKFEDVIARGAFGIDIHCADYSGCGVVGLKLEKGESYDIPYGCLVPRDVDGIMVAGRCISASHVALGSVRIMPVACATGQAAGAAAALCVRDGTQPRDLDVGELQELLIEQGANLGR